MYVVGCDEQVGVALRRGGPVFKPQGSPVFTSPAEAWAHVDKCAKKTDGGTAINAVYEVDGDAAGVQLDDKGKQLSLVHRAQVIRLVPRSEAEPADAKSTNAKPASAEAGDERSAAADISAAGDADRK